MCWDDTAEQNMQVSLTCGKPIFCSILKSNGNIPLLFVGPLSTPSLHHSAFCCATVLRNDLMILHSWLPPSAGDESSVAGLCVLGFVLCAHPEASCMSTGNTLCKWRYPSVPCLVLLAYPQHMTKSTHTSHCWRLHRGVPREGWTLTDVEMPAHTYASAASLSAPLRHGLHVFANYVGQYNQSQCLHVREGCSYNVEPLRSHRESK